MVVEVRYVGTRLVDGTDDRELELRNGPVNCVQELHEQRLPRRVQARAAEPAGRDRPGMRSGRPARVLVRVSGTRHRDASRCRSTSPTSTACRARRPAMRRATPAPTGPTPRGSTSWRRAIPKPGGAANALYGNATFRANLEAAGCRATSSCSTPTSTTPTSRPTGASRKYDSLQINLRRLLSGGLTLDANYTFAKRYDTALDDLRAPRRVVIARTTACRTRSRSPRTTSCRSAAASASPAASTRGSTASSAAGR